MEAIQITATVRSFSGEGRVIPIVVLQNGDHATEELRRKDSTPNPDGEKYHHDINCNYADHSSPSSCAVPKS